MSEIATDTKQLHVMLPLDMYEALKKEADEKRLRIADVVRDAIAAHLLQGGISVTSRVAYGGDRRKKSEAPPDT